MANQQIKSNADVSERFVAILLRAASAGAAHVELAAVTCELINARSVEWVPEVKVDDGSKAELEAEEKAGLESEDSIQRAGVLEKLNHQSSPVIEPVKSDPQVTIIGIKITGQGVLLCTLVSSPLAIPSFVAVLKLAAGYFVLANDRQQQNQLKSFAIDTSVRLSLMEVLFKTPARAEAFESYCGQVAQCSGASVVLLCLVPPRRGVARVSVISSNQQTESAGETGRLARKLAAEVLVAGEALVEELDNEGVCPSRNAEVLASHLRVKRVQAVALVDTGGVTRGAVLLAGDELSDSRMAQVRRAVASTAPVVFLRQHSASKGSAVEGRKRTNASAVVFGLLALGIGAMFIPVPNRIHSALKVTPIVRRFVAAPFDGVLLKGLVRSGDPIAEGGRLALMDDQPLELERSRLRAEQIRVRKQQEIHLAAGEIEKSQMSDIRLTELAASVELVEGRIRQAQIVSPIEGVVISRDLDDVEDSSVTMGQTLFEIAPLKVLRAEIEVPDFRASDLAVGQTVSIWIENGDGEKRTGEITRITPQAEVRDRRNVVLCTVLITNDADLIRPGMEGRASIDAGQRPLGWLLFHRLWDRGRVYLGV